LTTSTPNLAQIHAILFFTLPRNLLETTSEEKVAPSMENPALQYAEQTTVKCPSSFQFRTDFVDVQSTFMTADELVH